MSSVISRLHRTYARPSKAKILIALAESQNWRCALCGAHMHFRPVFNHPDAANTFRVNLDAPTTWENTVAACGACTGGRNESDGYAYYEVIRLRGRPMKKEKPAIADDIAVRLRQAVEERCRVEGMNPDHINDCTFPKTNKEVTDEVFAKMVEGVMTAIRKHVVKPVAPRRLAHRKNKAKIGRTKRATIFEAQNWKCFYCGIKMVYRPRQYHASPTIDHIVPLRDGGAKTNVENMVGACLACNTVRASLELRGVIKDAREFKVFVDTHGRHTSFKTITNSMFDF